MTKSASTFAIVRAKDVEQDDLRIDPALVERWLVNFLRDELVRRRSVTKAVVGVSGGVDSAPTIGNPSISATAPSCTSSAADSGPILAPPVSPNPTRIVSTTT